jgi:hypothetical protein
MLSSSIGGPVGDCFFDEWLALDAEPGLESEVVEPDPAQAAVVSNSMPTTTAKVARRLRVRVIGCEWILPERVVGARHDTAYDCDRLYPTAQLAHPVCRSPGSWSARRRNTTTAPPRSPGTVVPDAAVAPSVVERIPYGR